MSTAAKNLSLEFQRKAAKQLLKELSSGDSQALELASRYHPEHSSASSSESYALHDAQLIVARQRGFPSWPAMVAYSWDDESDTAGLSEDELKRFHEDGFVRISPAFDSADAARMESFIWNAMNQVQGIDQSDPSTWNKPGPWAGLKHHKREPLFASIYKGRFHGICDQLLGKGTWKKPVSSGGFLVTMPKHQSGEWFLPGKGWHVDAHYTFEPNELFGLRIFSYISNVGHAGGGTLVVKGSHQLVKTFVEQKTVEERRQGYRDLQNEFKKTAPWLTDLCNEKLADNELRDPARTRRFEEGTTIDKVGVSVVELTGKPGDMVIAHPWILHNASVHSVQYPRMMITKDVFLLDAKGLD